MLRIGSADGSTTAIHELDGVSAKENGIYNINGQRMSDNIEQLPKGIYIYLGKKIKKIVCTNGQKSFFDI